MQLKDAIILIGRLLSPMTAPEYFIPAYLDRGHLSQCISVCRKGKQSAPLRAASMGAKINTVSAML